MVCNESNLKAKNLGPNWQCGLRQLSGQQKVYDGLRQIFGEWSGYLAKQDAAVGRAINHGGRKHGAGG